MLALLILYYYVYKKDITQKIMYIIFIKFEL